VAIINPRLGETGCAVYVIYNLKQMPKYLEWRMMVKANTLLASSPVRMTSAGNKRDPLVK